MSGDERGGTDGRPLRTDGGQGPEDLTDLKGIGSSRAEKLRDAGFETVADLRAASQEDLAEVLGSGLAGRVKSQVEDVTAAGEPDEAGEPDVASGQEPAEAGGQPSVPSGDEPTDETAGAEGSDDIGWEPDDGAAEEAGDQPSTAGTAGESGGEQTDTEGPTVPGSSTDASDDQEADATAASSEGPTVEQGGTGDSVEPTAERESGSSEDSMLAALVSFFIPGVGNMINGDTDRGLVIFVVWVVWLVVAWGIGFFVIGSIITVITFGFGIIIQGLIGLVLGVAELAIHIIAAIDAYRRSEIVDNVTGKVDQVRS